MKHLCSILFFIIIICPLWLEGQTKDDMANIEFIKSFVDYYKQAYEKKNLPFLEELFGNDALIITETFELKKADKTLNNRIKKDRKFKTIIKNKKEYINELKQYFAENNSIIIEYSKLEISKHNKYPEIYGISFLQYRKSSNNSTIEDQYMGYLFIMIDFHKKDSPMIHIRTWQPMKNINNPNDIYNLYDFEIL